MTANLVVVPELGSAGAGAIVYWRLSPLPVAYEALCAAWAEAGLPPDLLLTTPEPETALRRAVSGQRNSRRLVRPIRGGGFALIADRTSKAVATPDDVELRCDAVVKLDKVGRVSVEPAAPRLRDEIAEVYDRMLGQINDDDVSGWLTAKLIPYVQGVSLRPSGGMYFIPRPQVPTWSRIVDALRDSSNHRIFAIPAMETAEAVAAILDAIEQEAAAEVNSVAKDLETQLGAGAIDTRLHRTSALEEKVGQYEELLGVRLDAMREKLDALRAQLTVAAAKAEACRE